MKNAAKELNTSSITKIIKVEKFVFKAIILDEIDKYRKIG